MPDRKRPVPFPPVHLPLRHGVPTEIQLPVEAPVGHVGARHVLEGVVTDHIDNGAYHCFSVGEGKTKEATRPEV